MKLLKLNALLLLAAVLILSGCPSPTDSGDGGTDAITVPVTAVTVDALAELLIEETTDLTATITPTNANTGITWSSSNEDIATVNANGVVTGIAQGSAVITVASTIDPSIKAQTAVEVYISKYSLEGFKIYNQLDIDGNELGATGTTTTVPSIVNDTLNIENHALAYFKNESSFHSNTVLYFDTPLSAEFRIKARFKRENIINEAITDAAGSSNRGVLLGAIELADDGSFESGQKYAMLFSRTRGDVRSYYYKDNAVGAGSPNIDKADALTEYIFEVKRDALSITFSVYNSVTGDLVEENIVNNTSDTAGSGLDSGLHSGQALYPAIIVGGAKVQISNLEIYSGPAESEIKLYSTTEVDGSSVSVSSVAVSGPSNNSYEITENEITKTINYSNAFAAGMATLQLEETVTPSLADDISVSWTSSDEAVATVSASGEVTLKAAGDVTITATTTDQGFTASYNIHLTDGTVEVDSITITGITDDTLMQGLTGTLRTSITPLDATDQSVTWLSSNTDAATIDAETGKITALTEAASVTFTATANDGSGETQTYNLAITQAEDILFMWAVPSIFDATSAPATVGGKTVTIGGGSPEVTSEGIDLSASRLNIGTKYNQKGTNGGTLLVTSSTVNVDDGEFNFLNKKTIVTINYSSSNASETFEPSFRCYINNTKASESSSVLYAAATDESAKVKAYVGVDTDLVAEGGTTSFTIDSAVYNNHESLSAGCIMLRCDSSSDIMITSITIEYAD